MARTNIRGSQVLDSTIQRSDIDVITIGQSVITKVTQGNGITLSASGADAGTGDVQISCNSNILAVSINTVIDGAGDTIITGSKLFLEIPLAITITGWSLTADQSGSIVIDIKKCSYSGFPTTTSICSATLPTISSAQKSQNLSLSGWTTSISAGDILEFVVNSITTIQRITLSLRGTKS